MTQTVSLFSMSFNELCKNFNDTHPVGYKGTKTGNVLFVKEWKSGALNDMLRPYLINNGFPYFEDMDGRIWFSDDGVRWKSIFYEVRGNIVTAHEVV